MDLLLFLLPDIWNWRIWWSADGFKSCPAANGEGKTGKAGNGHCMHCPTWSSGHPLLCTPQTGKQVGNPILFPCRPSLMTPKCLWTLMDAHSSTVHGELSEFLRSLLLAGQEASKDSHGTHTASSQVQNWGLFCQKLVLGMACYGHGTSTRQICTNLLFFFPFFFPFLSPSWNF